MKVITKIKLFNFKRFQNFEVEFNEKRNLLIGDNESGKSSILTAIDLVLSGNRSKIDSIGLENLFNKDVIDLFLSSDRKYQNLPKLKIEVYLNEQNNPNLNGKINTDGTACDGLVLECVPDDTLSKEIKEILETTNPTFPFEYYIVNFRTFAGGAYSGYKKYLKHILIDNAQISNEYAMREYIRDVYDSSIKSLVEKTSHHHQYREHKENFTNTSLAELNGRLGDKHSFAIKTTPKANLETDIIIMEDGINIENKGKGRECFVKTELALKKAEMGLDIILIEEPENHLSHINMKKLVEVVSEASDKQVFITTHNSLISTRLDLRNVILLNSNAQVSLKLAGITESTAKFFMKSPNNNILEFALSKKAILIEGDGEYILMEAFYKKETGSKPEKDDVHIISASGLGFKRYLEVAQVLGIKTAVITDNDKDYQENCVNRYASFASSTIRVFSDSNNDNYTFEKCIYEANKDACDALFLAGRRKLTVLEYMVTKNNKTDVAFTILTEKLAEITIPQYIKDAIIWIKE